MVIEQLVDLVVMLTGLTKQKVYEKIDSLNPQEAEKLLRLIKF